MRALVYSALIAATITMAAFVPSGAQATAPYVPPYEFRWAVKIPMRDGVKLNATLYTPGAQNAPAPCIFTLTPYISANYHDRGIYFASQGLSFLTIDVRGRGNSEGEFRPMIQEAHDGYDIVEWLAKQPYCNGKVAMWGGSYAGYDQWATTKELPPHLATIVPVAAPYMGFDVPMVNNIFFPYMVQWLTHTAGHASQAKIFEDSAFWGAQNRRWLESGLPFKQFDTLVGNPSPVFQEWLSHPYRDTYWDSYNPTAEQLSRLAIPILTITGSHDADQAGALEHYREHLKNASPEVGARHYLVIGPWDHAGTRTPEAQFGGLTVGPNSLVDLNRLHREWYAWTMQGGAQPEFLKKRVAYYVMEADEWHYADTLESVTREMRPLNLSSASNAADVVTSGSLTTLAADGKPDHYVYDPHDVSLAATEAGIDPEGFVDQRMVYARRGEQLVYHTAPFEHDTEISGFFKLSAWISIDQPDTDFFVSISEIRPDGSNLPLSSDQMRARYRESLRQPRLVTTKAPIRYAFERFSFVSRKVKAGSRLRLVISSGNSINLEKNYNSGGEVAAESMQDARPVTVALYHDRAHPSVLYIPVGAK